MFYPGVPLRKLYKRYSTKLEKHKAAVITGEGRQLIPDTNMLVGDGKKNQKTLESKEGAQEAVKKNLVGKRGRGKRKFSSDGEMGQKKKVARKSDDFSATTPSEDQSIPTDQSVNKSCKKRIKGNDEDGDDQVQQKMTKGRRLSTRLQKKKTSVESVSADENLPQPKNSTNRKKRKRTTDSQEDIKETLALSKEQEQSSDAPVMSHNEERLVDGFVSDAMWTDLYRPVHSTEVMANASAVSKLRSWLEEWKVKREKTLRKELQQQKRYSSAFIIIYM